MLPRIQRKMDHGIVSTIKPLLESWAGIKLSHEGMPQPGGRRYLRGANMLMHVDAKSHLIGAILQVHPNFDITNDRVNPFLFTISRDSLYQIWAKCP